MKRVARTVLFASLLAATAVHAVPTTYEILLDLDNLASTGCTVSGTWGSFAGVEERLVVSVNTTGPAAAIVDQIERQSCTTPPSTFGPLSLVDPGDWPVGIGNGTLGQNVIEAYYPLPALNPPFVRYAVVARDAAGAEDAILTTTPTSGQPLVIQLASVVEIPTLSGLGFLGLGILLSFMAVVLLRRRVRGVAIAVALLALGSAAWGITCVLDGQTTEWTGIPPAGTDASNDGTPGSEIVAVFAAEDAGQNEICFRIDGSLQFNAAPTANDQSPAAGNEDTAQPLTLTGSDPDSDPLTFTIVTPPTNGGLSALTGATATSVNVTYTPNANFAGSDSFVFQVADGLGGTDTGTVSLTVTAVDDPPAAVNDAATVAEDSGASAVAVLANDTDVDAGPISITAVTQPTNGAVVITGGGTGLTYQPNTNYCNNPPGTTLDTFTYTLTPGSSVATVTMTVTCVDDNPTAVADSATVTEDDPATAVSVLANDTDLDGGPISVASVTQPANGTVVITGGGTGLTYAPNGNYCNNPPGTTLDAFTYTLTPGGSVATVTMTVNCVDDNPTAVADAATVTEDDPATAVSVLANDTDPDGGAISISLVTQPANGAVVITGGGTGLTYAPNANYCNNPPGTTLDTFTYTLTPGSSSTTVTMTVTCVDDNPVAVADAATVAEDSGANAVSVLANDTDIDAGPMSVTSVTQPANGAVAITGGGTGLTYAPNANYCNNPPGTTLDTFTYTLTPGGSVATVTMTVTCVDDAPVAVADAATVNEDSGASAVNVLANDTDVDGGSKLVFSVTQPANGAVVITGGGTGLTYAPNANYCNNPPGTTLDSFTYTLAPGGSSTTVTMTVTCLNDGPLVDLDANDDQGTGGSDFAITFTEGDAAKLLEDALDASVTDVDNTSLASLTVVITNLFDTGFETLSTDVTGTSITAGYATVPGAPGTGTLTLTGPDTLANFETVLRKVRYVNTSTAPNVTPRAIQFVANDGATNGNTAVSTVTMVSVDTNPTAVADAATVLEDAAATAVGVLANDTDPDGGPMSIASVTQPANGTVAITGGGTGLTYQPNANYCNNPPGTTLDVFTYTLTPGGSSTTVAMTVTCVDDNPVAVADAATVLEDSGATAVSVLANDTDVDGGPISITSVTQPTNGAVVITGGGTGLTYAPNANYCNNPPGTTLDTFTYTLTPGGSSTTVTMTVTCVDDDPVAVADAATVSEDDPATAVNVLANDTDPDGGAISITSVTQPANGTVVITGGGTGLTYAPNANYCNNPPGTTLDTFTYTLTPGGSSTTVTMTVTCVDDPPVAVADAATVNEDSGATAVPVLTNDTDVDGGAKLVFSVTQPANGAVVITGGGTGLTYAPNLNYCNNPPGTTLDTFTYTLTPGGSSTTVTMTVTCVNDPPVADNDTFDFIGNTELRVDTGAAATPHALETTPSTFGVIDGDSDPVEGDAISVSSISVGACTDNAGPTFDCTDAGVGTVHMQTNGRFSFEPAPGDTGASETFTYVLTDNGLPAPASAGPATVTLTRFQRVWYVNPGGAAGAGTSTSPLNAVTALNGAGGAGDSDLVNDYIFIYLGNSATTPLTGGLELETGQHLIGEHAGLSIPVNLNLNGSPTNLVTAVSGNRPLIDNAAAGGSAVFATDQIPIEIVGLSLAGNTNGIDLTTTAPFAGTGSTEIRDNVIRSSGAEGIDVNHAGTAAFNLSIHDNNVTAGGDGIDVNRSGAGSTAITAFDDNVVTGTTGGIGIEIVNAIFDQTPGNPINQVGGGATVIGASGVGNGVGTSGIVMTNVTGDLSFTDLDIFNDAGTSLGVTSTGVLNAGAGTGFRIAVAAGVATIDSAAGPAVSVNNASVSLPLLFLESTNSTTTGLSLVNAFGGVAGTALSVSSGLISDPGGASGTAVNISGGNGNITLAIPITNTSGNSVVVTGRTGDTVSFSGAINETGSGISLTTNTGATINFSGGITASTGTNPAFTATGGALALNVTGTNTLTTTTGTALNVASTTIGASGLTFRSISSNGGTNGIVLNSTGATAGLTVTGTGSAGTGGTIQNKATGISLTDTRSPSFSWLQLNNFVNSAVSGRGVDGFTMQNSVINGTSGSSSVPVEGAINFGLPAPGAVNGLTGTALLRNLKVSGSIEHQLEFYNISGSLNLTIDGVNAVSEGADPNSAADDSADCIIEENSVASGSDGIQMEFRGTAQATVLIDRCLFRDNKSQAVQVSALEQAAMRVTIDESFARKFDQGNEAFLVSNGNDADLTVMMSNNHCNNFGGVCFFVGQVPGNATSASSLDATISGNVVSQPTTATNHAIIAFLTTTAGQQSVARVRIDGNNVTNNSTTGTTRGILVDTPDAGVGPKFDATVTNNTVSVGDNVAGVAGIVVQGRQTAAPATDVCANIGNNTVTFPNGTPAGVQGLRARQANTATYDLEQSAGCSGTAATVLACRNPGSTTEVLGTLTVVASGTCQLPSLP